MKRSGGGEARSGSKRRRRGARGAHDDDPAAEPEGHESVAAPRSAAAAAAAASQGPRGDDDGDDEADAEVHGPGHQAPPLGPPEPLTVAVAAAALAQLTGVPLASATEAVAETRERALGAEGTAAAAGSSAEMLQAWLDEAQVWLAVNNEVQEEIADVRVAMQESLQAYEATKAAEDLPLAQRPPDFLRDKFSGVSGPPGTPRSAVLERLNGFACHRALFAEGARHKAGVVKLADLECKCRRWYSNKGTSRFWDGVAQQCCEAAAEAATAAEAAAAADLLRTGWLGCEQGPAACSTCGAALGAPSGGAAPPRAGAHGRGGGGDGSAGVVRRTPRGRDRAGCVPDAGGVGAGARAVRRAGRSPAAAGGRVRHVRGGRAARRPCGPAAGCGRGVRRVLAHRSALAHAEGAGLVAALEAAALQGALVAELRACARVLRSGRAPLTYRQGQGRAV